MKEIDEFFRQQGVKNRDGTLTVGEAIFGYYRLLEGKKAGKVIIKTCAKINGEPVLFFANGLVWINADELKDIRCEKVSPTFAGGFNHSIDRSQATWYNDNGNKPQCYEW